LKILLFIISLYLYIYRQYTAANKSEGWNIIALFFLGLDHLEPQEVSFCLDYWK